MVNEGPCNHCGVTVTFQWRNGPPQKPILCNACGIHWSKKGTLANYTPLHTQPEPDDFRDYKVSRVKNISMKTRETKLYKRKQSQDNVVVQRDAPHCDHNSQKFLKEDTNNRLSYGSAVSYLVSESCARFGVTDASDLTGSAQSIVWDTIKPSRESTCLTHPQLSTIKRLAKDLCSILHEQQSSCLSGSLEEDLLYLSETPMGSIETGHGSILIRHTNLAAREEESKTSSLSVQNKPYPLNEAYSGCASLPVHIDNKGNSFPSFAVEKFKKPTGQGIKQKHTKMKKSDHQNSRLRWIDLKAVFNFEDFVRNFTHEEQQQLMKYLPLVDTARLPDSLKSMFDSPQFKENITFFLQLLVEGVFNISFLGVNTEDCMTLKRLVLVNLTRSKWVEHYNLLKDVKRKNGTGGTAVAIGPTSLASNNLVPVKIPCDAQNQSFPEPKGHDKKHQKGSHED